MRTAMAATPRRSGACRIQSATRAIGADHEVGRTPTGLSGLMGHSESGLAAGPAIRAQTRTSPNWIATAVTTGTLHAGEGRRPSGSRTRAKTVTGTSAALV